MAIPEISVYQVDSTNIILNWAVDKTGSVYSWNLYGSGTYNGTYTIRQTKIPNVVTKKDICPGNVFAVIPRASLGIASDAPMYFKITSVAKNGTESTLANSKFVAVDALDDVIRNRMSDNINPVYKSVTVAIVSGNTNIFVDLQRILGREASYTRITTDNDVFVKFNSSANDNVLVRSSTPLILEKGDLAVKSAYLTFISANANVTIFVSGD